MAATEQRLTNPDLGTIEGMFKVNVGVDGFNAVPLPIGDGYGWGDAMNWQSDPEAAPDECEFMEGEHWHYVDGGSCPEAVDY